MSIDVFFRIFNFLVLVGLGSFLFYKYLFPTLKSALQIKKNAPLRLQQEVVRLKQEQELLAQQKKEQEVLCKQLYDKVDCWKKAWSEKKQASANNNLKIKAFIKQRRAKQEHNYELTLAYKKIKPVATLLLSQKLAEQFNTSESKKAYTAKIISFLKNTL